jgi:inner membrane protein
MDNVTHALFGMLVADAAVLAVTPRGQEPDPRFRLRARCASAIANNLPDLDFMLRGITPGRVGYLLHHRGHSHTLGIGLLLGLASFALLMPGERLIVALLEAIARRVRRADPPSRPERWVLLALSLFGTWIHVAMDYTNNYGVHPFWPLYDGWFFGDGVFIIEPLYFILAVPALAFASRARAARIALYGIVLVTLGVAWVTRFAGVGTAMFLTLAAPGSAFFTSRLAPRQRTLVALTACVVMALSFLGLSRLARARVMEAVQGSSPGARVHVVDASLTPAPSNPFCWSAMAVGTRGDAYELLVATVALAPRFVPVAACEVEPTGRSLALRIPGVTSTPWVRWDGEWTAPLADLRALWHSNCDARAYLRWARLPFWFREGPRQLFLGDLRYDRSPELDFAETRGTLPPASCPPWVPPWIPPRQDLIAPE